VPQITGKSLHFSSFVLKKPRIFWKASHHFKKASILQKNVFKKPRNLCKTVSLIKKSLNLSGNVLEIFNKASIHIEKASNFLKIFLKCNAFLKKSLAFKKKPLGNYRIATMASPLLLIIYRTIKKFEKHVNVERKIGSGRKYVYSSCNARELGLKIEVHHNTIKNYLKKIWVHHKGKKSAP
jgi:hypothetical protein